MPLLLHRSPDDDALMLAGELGAATVLELDTPLADLPTRAGEA